MAKSDKNITKIKLSRFFGRFSELSLTNYLLIFVFLLLNFSGYIGMSFTRVSKEEALGAAVSDVCKKIPAKSLTLSFVNHEKTNNATFQRFASDAYFDSHSKTDTIGYDIRYTFNNVPSGTYVNIDVLGKDYTPVICKNMSVYENDDSVFTNGQTNLHFEFNRSGSTKSDFKEGTTNFIYIRESDADKLIKSEGTPFYGLTHSQLLGMGLDVELTYQTKTIKDKWKIDNIILENDKDEIEQFDKHLNELYGNYFMSSMYGYPILSGGAIQLELGTSAVANSRNIRYVLLKYGNEDFEITFDSKSTKAEVAELNSFFNGVISTPNDTNIILTIVFSSLIILFQIASCIAFYNIKAYRVQNICLFAVAFVVPYLIFFVLNKISPFLFGIYFCSFAIVLNLILTIASITSMIVIKINRPSTYPEYQPQKVRTSKRSKNV